MGKQYVRYLLQFWKRCRRAWRGRDCWIWLAGCRAAGCWWAAVRHSAAAVVFAAAALTDRAEPAAVPVHRQTDSVMRRLDSTSDSTPTGCPWTVWCILHTNTAIASSLFAILQKLVRLNPLLGVSVQRNLIILEVNKHGRFIGIAIWVVQSLKDIQRSFIRDMFVVKFCLYIITIMLTF